MIRILIVTETRLYREGLNEILGRDGRLKVVGAADSSEAVSGSVERLGPDAVLIDVGMPGALEAVRRIRGAPSPPKIVALGLSETHDVLVCAQAGIAGYVSRDASVEELVTVVESAARGELVCSSRVAGALLRGVRTGARGDSALGAPARLTPREREIVGLIDQGMTNKEIGRRLFIEVTTVKNHVHNILEKLGVATRGQAAARVRAHSELIAPGSTPSLNPKI